MFRAAAWPMIFCWLRQLGIAVDVFGDKINHDLLRPQEKIRSVHG